MVDNRLGKRIKEMREYRNMSQSELAASMNVSKSTISDYENGEIKPSLDNFIKIACCLKCSANELLQDYIEQSNDFYFRQLVRSLTNLSSEKLKEIIELIKMFENEK